MKTNQGTLQLQTALKEVAKVYDTKPGEITAQLCDHEVITAFVCVAIGLGIPDDTIVELFKEDNDWLREKGKEGEHLHNDERYQTALTNSQMALMTDAVEESSDGGSVEETPSFAKPRASKRASDVCENVFLKAEEYFGASRDEIIKAITTELRDMKDKCVVAMKASGAKLGEIKKAVGLGYDGAVYAAMKKVQADDKDVKEIMVDSSSTVETTPVPRVKDTSALAPVTPAPQGKSRMPESLEKQKTSPKSSQMRKLADMIFARFCTADLLFAADPVAELATAREILICVASDSLEAEMVSAGLGVSETFVYETIGRVTMKLKRDPALAKTVRSILRELN